MEQQLAQLELFRDASTKLTLLEGLAAICLTFALTLLITSVYRATYAGRNYSQSFVHTIIIMSVVVAVIMIVIGNNIAVAFGLVGAFSIIRFRTAMNDPKDIAFIFFGMGAGIACGLGFYLLAIVFTVTVCAVVYALQLFNYGHRQPEQRLRILVPENVEYARLFDDIFRERLDSYVLNEVETINLGTALQLEYAIRLKHGVDEKQFIDAIRERNANLKISLGMQGVGR